MSASLEVTARQMSFADRSVGCGPSHPLAAVGPGSVSNANYVDGSHQFVDPVDDAAFAATC